MKFTKEQFLETLKTKYAAEKLLTDRTLQGAESLYSLAGEETEMEDFIKQITPTLDAFAGQARKMNSDHFKEKQEWEKAHPKDEPKPKEPQEPNDKLDALLKEIGELKKEREAEKAAKALSDYKNDIQSRLQGELKDFSNSKGWIERRMKSSAFNIESDKDEVVKNFVADFNADFAGIKPNQTPQHTGGGGDEKVDYSDIVERRKRAMHIEQ